VKDIRRPSLQQTDSAGEATGDFDDPGGRLYSLSLHPEDNFRDRRKATRLLLSGFAVIHTLDPDGRKGRYRVARLHDISTTGIGLRLNATDPDNFRDGREFEILFQFTEHGKPRHMTCIACRHAMEETGLAIGAVFRNPLMSLAEIGRNA